MRLVAGLLALTLTGTLAYADEAKAPEPQSEAARPKVGLRVVRVMPESHQALLFDRNRGTHVLADVGSVIGTYTVMEIDEDEVTLSSAGRVVILPAPEPTPAPAPRAIPAKKAPAADTKVVAPSDPYAEPAAIASEAPADPYAAPEAPADPYWVAAADPYAKAPAVKRVAAAPEAPEDPYADAEVRTAPVAKPATAAEGAVRIAAAPSSVPMTNPYDEAALEAALTAGAGSVRVPAAPDAITVTEMEVDPYGEPAPAPPRAPMDADPYAEPMTAPPAPAAMPTEAPTKPARSSKSSNKEPLGNDGVRAFAEAMSGEVSDLEEAPAAKPAVPPAPAAEPATMLSRKELNNALSDFGVLTASVRGAFTPEGARIDTVAQGSVFAKAGLRGGDVITAVDGQPLKSIDDAADLYLRAGSARTAKVQLLRAGKPMTLRLAIQ